MIGSGSITRRLAYESSDIFRELAADFEGRKKLDFSLNLLSGVLEQNLPYYYLSDLPNHSQLIQKRKALQEEALGFLHREVSLLLSLLSDETIKSEQLEKLFYLLAKYLPEAGVSFREYLRFGLVTLELASRGTARSLPRQALCRYDLAPTAQYYGIDLECGKAPYPELLKRLQESLDAYTRLYLLLTHEARILYLRHHEALPSYDPLLVESLLSSLPLSNPEALRTALEQSARRPDPLAASENIANESQSISRSQTITQTVSETIKKP